MNQPQDRASPSVRLGAPDGQVSVRVPAHPPTGLFAKIVAESDYYPACLLNFDGKGISKGIGRQ